MYHYHGMFKDVYETFGGAVKSIGVYEGDFAEFYNTNRASEKESSVYIEEAAQCGNRVLELCCGNGRLTTEFAGNGFDITGIDILDDMLAILQKKKEALPFRISKRISIENQDVYSMNLSGKFNFIFLPATTICILVDDLIQTKEFFCKVADLLEDDGSFMFDVRLYDKMRLEENGISSVLIDNKVVLYQEFIDEMEGRAIGNFLMVEKQSEGQMQMYLTYSNKRIL